MTLVFVAVVVGVLAIRRRRKSELSGLNAARPVFQTEPPLRRLSGLKGRSL